MAFERLVERLIALRWGIAALLGLGVVLSLVAIRTAPLDAIPDPSDPQLVVYAKWARSPELLEERITGPLVGSLLGTPGVRAVRGTSHMGYSFIYVVLRSKRDLPRVRERVTTRLTALRAQLPPDASLSLGPAAGSMGWIYQYALIDRRGARSLFELRQIQDTIVRPRLQAVAGVAEVAPIGGLEKQYQLKLFPPLLAQSGLSLQDVATALTGAFEEVGGRVIEITNRDYQVRGALDTQAVDQLEGVVLGRSPAGTAVRLGDVGYLQVGYDQRRSIAELDGEGEVVGGIVIMEQNANVIGVTRAVTSRLQELRAVLPAGIELVPTYERSALVMTTLENFAETLLYELVVVIVIVLVFLRNLRSAVAPIAILLLATLFTVLPMVAFGQTINLLSLAGLAIAIGEMVDATIVIVENCSAELARRGAVSDQERRRVVVRAIAAVTRPLLFSLLIILASFLPIFFLGAREARLFDPLAFAKTSAIAFSTLLTLVLLPILVLWSHSRGIAVARESRPRISWPYRFYARVLRAVLRFRYVFIAASAIALVPAIVALVGMRRDYMPELEEGSILYMPTTLPGVPMREAGWILRQMNQKLKGFPEVERVFGKLGRADTATDPAPVTMIETTLQLKPRSQWRAGMTKDRLVAQLDAEMQIIGFVNSWSQPMATRVLMQDTGIQTPVGLKVRGRDIREVERIARRAEELLREVPGTQSVIAERISEGYFIDVQFDLRRAGERGVSPQELAATVRYGIGGDNVIMIPSPDGGRLPLSLQYSNEYQDNLAKVAATPVMTGSRQSVPLEEVAHVAVSKRPEMLRNDNGQLAGFVYVYLRAGTTAPDYVRRARQLLERQLELPSGYSIEWTGLYQYAMQARARLSLVVPITLLIIAGLLALAFRSWKDCLVVLLSVPFSMVGGVALQHWLGYPVTTAVVIGYVALFAVAVQTGIVMIVFIRQALAERAPGQSYEEAVIAGSTARLRPKMMTVAATMLSLVPVMLSNSQGSEVLKPIAAPTVGGMATSTLYVLLLIPCLYVAAHDLSRWRARRRSTQE